MKKQKIKREFSAGGAVFRKGLSPNSRQEETLWLVIRPTASDKWRLPKGRIDGGETSLEAAEREVAEEAGIKAATLAKIGTEKYFFVQDKEKIFKTVVFYLMSYLREVEGGFGWETEKIDWLPLEKAKKRLAFKKEKEILEKAARYENSKK